jgi:hypothetical protein
LELEKLLQGVFLVFWTSEKRTRSEIGVLKFQNVETAWISASEIPKRQNGCDGDF